MKSKSELSRFLDLYRLMVATREIDTWERRLAQQGEAFFYVPSAGHEAVAALAPYLTKEDWLHGHYRDRALLLGRGVPVEAFFRLLLGKAEGDSGGRRMPGFISDPSLNLMSTPTVVGSGAPQTVGVAAAIKDRPGNPLVVCSLGDGATQEGDFLEAVAESVRRHLPVLFLVEDNRYALSTPTRGRTFYSLPGGDAAEFYGLPIVRIDGTDVMAADKGFRAVVHALRTERGPQLVHLQVERLASHSNADDETLYRSADEIQRAHADADAVPRLRARLRAEGVSETELDELEECVRVQVADALDLAREGSTPEPEHTAKRPLPEEASDPAREYLGGDTGRDLTMMEALRGVLRHRLGADERVSLEGEDIEDPKGDVFGLTKGLSSDFPGRVRNAALAEVTIVGSAIGRALAGERPVALLQFADFIPVAYNQLASELGTLHWRSRGAWQAPVIVMAICGAYRPGLGPFHAQTPDAICAHIPGIDVLMPSTAADAAGLLNAAFESGRPTIFLYPKNLINARDAATTADVERQFVPIGRARVARAGSELTLVSWGSTMPLCDQAAKALEEGGASVELIDLRSISPWDQDAVIASARKTGRLLVVHEDTRSFGVGAEIIATAAEFVPHLQCARVARSDTYIPYNFSAMCAVLPSFKSVLTRAADMLDMDLQWREKARQAAGMVVVNAIGSSPSDETLQIMELHVAEGDEVEEGQPLASVEADKAAMEISAPVSGTVDKIWLRMGETVKVGVPLAQIRASETSRRRPMVVEDPGLPVLNRRRQKSADCAAPAVLPSPLHPMGHPVILNSIYTAVGSRKMLNEDFLAEFPEWTSDDVRRRTGIEERYWIGEGEDVLTLAVKASRKLLDAEGLDVADLDTIICCTGTPLAATTPSLACRILHALSPEKGEVMVQAYDINAACTGWLYALQAAYDTLKYDARRKIMIVSAETLSPLINRKDPDTAFIFGDAATAALLTGERRSGNMHARMHRPVLSALGVDEYVLRVPFPGSGEHVQMQGGQVFRVAVRKMVDMLDLACSAENVTVNDLDMIVTHQANERIIEAARKMIKFPKERVFNQMRIYGNTSSNTIPLALTTVIPRQKPDDKIGLTAFGGGFTFGAAVIEVV